MTMTEPPTSAGPAGETAPTGGCGGRCDHLTAGLDSFEDRRAWHDRIIDRLAGADIEPVCELLEALLDREPSGGCPNSADVRCWDTPGAVHWADASLFLAEHRWQDPVTMRRLAAILDLLLARLGSSQPPPARGVEEVRCRRLVVEDDTGQARVEVDTYGGAGRLNLRGPLADITATTADGQARVELASGMPTDQATVFLTADESQRLADVALGAGGSIRGNLTAYRGDDGFAAAVDIDRD